MYASYFYFEDFIKKQSAVLVLAKIKPLFKWNDSLILTHFLPMQPFFIPENITKPGGFLGL